jgi:predicted transcriptional regulator
MQNSLPDHIDPIELTTSVVVAYISNNSVPKSELPGLIEAVHGAFSKLMSGQSVVEAPAEVQAPAVSVRKSLTPDYLICLDDGTFLLIIRWLRQTMRRSGLSWQRRSVSARSAPVMRLASAVVRRKFARKRDYDQTTANSCGLVLIESGCGMFSSSRDPRKPRGSF